MQSTSLENKTFSLPTFAVPRQLVFIIGSGRSGSTLLDMCLGGHSHVSSLGETGFLYFYANNTTKKDICTCGEPLATCAFWQKVEAELLYLTGSGFKNLPLSDPARMVFTQEGNYHGRLPGETLTNSSILRDASVVLGVPLLFELAARLSPVVRTHHTAAVNRHCLYEAVWRAYGTPVIVDSTKTPGAVKEAWMTSRLPCRFIRLYRDGRAVAASHMRRLKIPMETAAQMWRRDMMKWKAAALLMPSRDIIDVRYEDFSRNPVEELVRICRFLGLVFEPELLDFRKDRHNLGGNPMRFRTQEVAISPDERWKSEVTAEDLEIFDRVAGKLNRSLAYA